MSVASQDLLSTLDQFADELTALQEICRRATEAIEAGTIGAGLRNELSQCHGDANKLLATRIDAVVTGDLTSGRDDARKKRKSEKASYMQRRALRKASWFIWQLCCHRG